MSRTVAVFASIKGKEKLKILCMATCFYIIGNIIYSLPTLFPYSLSLSSYSLSPLSLLSVSFLAPFPYFFSLLSVPTLSLYSLSHHSFSPFSRSLLSLPYSLFLFCPPTLSLLTLSPYSLSLLTLSPYSLSLTLSLSYSLSLLSLSYSLSLSLPTLSPYSLSLVLSLLTLSPYYLPTLSLYSLSLRTLSLSVLWFPVELATLDISWTMHSPYPCLASSLTRCQPAGCLRTLTPTDRRDKRQDTIRTLRLENLHKRWSENPEIQDKLNKRFRDQQNDHSPLSIPQEHCLLTSFETIKTSLEF